MPITIYSPYDGEPVKIRDQDVGRAVRDREGRIFYVVKRSVGEGYYSSPTRAGSPRDETRYVELEQKVAQARENIDRPAPVVHDVTGRRKSSVRGKLVILVLALVVAAMFAAAYKYKDQWRKGPAAGTIELRHPLTPPAPPVTSGSSESTSTSPESSTPPASPDSNQQDK